MMRDGESVEGPSLSAHKSIFHSVKRQGNEMAEMVLSNLSPRALGAAISLF